MTPYEPNSAVCLDRHKCIIKSSPFHRESIRERKRERERKKFGSLVERYGSEVASYSLFRNNVDPDGKSIGYSAKANEFETIKIWGKN